MKPIDVVVMGLLTLIAINVWAGCEEDQFDIWKTSKAREQGLSKDSILAHLNANANEVGPARMQKIMGLIDEVYGIEQSQLPEWWRSKYKACAKEDDA